MIGATVQDQPTADAGEAAQALVCSARGCRADAVWQVEWNNPRLHTPERRKVWLACDDHRDQLAEFLDVRGFLRDVRPVTRNAPR